LLLTQRKFRKVSPQVLLALRSLNFLRNSNLRTVFELAPFQRVAHRFLIQCRKYCTRIRMAEHGISVLVLDVGKKFGIRLGNCLDQTERWHLRSNQRRSRNLGSPPTHSVLDNIFGLSREYALVESNVDEIIHDSRFQIFVQLSCKRIARNRNARPQLPPQLNEFSAAFNGFAENPCFAINSFTREVKSVTSFVTFRM
jgi:hypothetical protein